MVAAVRPARPNRHGAAWELLLAGEDQITKWVALALMRGRWAAARSSAGLVTAYGLVAVAGCQLAYFNAVRTLSVGVDLLLE